MGGLSKYYRQRLSLFSRPEYITGVLYSISTCLPAPDRQAGRQDATHVPFNVRMPSAYNWTRSQKQAILCNRPFCWHHYYYRISREMRDLRPGALFPGQDTLSFLFALFLKTKTLLGCTLSEDRDILRDDKRDSTHRISQARLKRYAHHILLLPLMLGTYILPLLQLESLGNHLHFSTVFFSKFLDSLPPMIFTNLNMILIIIIYLLLINLFTSGISLNDIITWLQVKRLNKKLFFHN